MAVGDLPIGDEDVEMMERSNGKKLQTIEANSAVEPYEGMEFESEEAAKIFYDTYATRVGFIIRVDAFRRSMRDGAVVWRRLVCNKQGFRRVKPKQNETRRSRAVTREGCKAMIMVKKQKSGKWVVTRLVREHSHPLVNSPTNSRRSALPSHTADEKDAKIRELTAELQRERRRSAVLQEKLNIVLKDMEEHSNHLARNVENIIQKVKDAEPNNKSLSYS
ncbi:hypothetical protein BVRB_5g118870 [Beta vulgaris subsp. vulgaris]|nr:hypothetical protein BVRB_5g118870 [Beta vulgaris subsp. vulgaris]